MDHECKFAQEFRMTEDFTGLEPDGLMCEICGARTEGRILETSHLLTRYTSGDIVAVNLEKG